MPKVKRKTSLKVFKIFELEDQICWSFVFEWDAQSVQEVNEQYVKRRKRRYKNIFRGNSEQLLYSVSSVLDSYYSRKGLDHVAELDSAIEKLTFRLQESTQEIDYKSSDDIFTNMWLFYPYLFRFIVQFQSAWSDERAYREYSAESLREIENIYSKLKNLFHYKYSLETRHIKGDITHPMFYVYMLGCQLSNAFYERIYRPMRDMGRALGLIEEESK